MLVETSNSNSKKTSTTQQTIDMSEKAPRTPSSPKQKSTTKAANTTGVVNTGRKASKAVHAAILEEDFYTVLHSHYYPSFVQAFLSKLICLASWHLSKRNLFEHIGHLYSQVIKFYL